jgi:hypothetical protein
MEYEKSTELESASATERTFAFLGKNYPMVIPIINGVKYVFPEYLQLIAYWIIIIIIAIVLLYTSVTAVTQIYSLF